jgi:predicted ATPase
LALVGRHLTNAQIAAELFISVRTVESHVAALLRKLQLPDRRALARHTGASGAAARARLPVPTTPFIGRVAEHAALTRALAEHRVVTAIGPGGIGKSRLAISVAADMAAVARDGVWFVDLVRVTDPVAVVAAVAEAVGASEQIAPAPEAALVSSLARRDGLLVLDNCEHLLDGVRYCVELIVVDCPDVTVLATSRTRLMLPYERLYTVPGLAVEGAGGDAVELFTERVREATGEEVPDAGRVGALCQALDGMALAIELAASRYPTLGLDGLEAGLHERLRFLTVGSRTAGRHRSLRDTVDWSYELLGDADRALLRGVAVFASWFDVDSACAVAPWATDRAAVADGLARLADHSLLVVDRGAPTRYRALETIRQYGQQLLEGIGELTAVESRHETWCCAVLADLAAAEPDDSWCARFDAVVDDARAALVRCAAHHDHRANAAKLAAQLAGQLWLRGRLTEARRWYEQAAELDPTPSNQVELLRMAAGAAGTGFAGTDMLRLLRAAADLALSLGDRSGAARDLAWASQFITRAPGIMSEKRTAGEAAQLLAEASALFDGSAIAAAAIALATASADGADLLVGPAEQAVESARLAGDQTIESAALDLLTAVHLRDNDLSAALRVVRQRDAVIGSLPMVASSGFELSDHCLYGSEVLLAAGDLAAAADYADRLARLPFNRTEHYIGVARRLKVGALAGHFDDVLRDADQFRTSWEDGGRPVVPNLGGCAYAVSMVHGILGDHAGRTEWAQLTDDIIGGQPAMTAVPWRSYRSTFDAIVALHRSQYHVAFDTVTVDVDDGVAWRDYGLTMYRPWYAAVWAEAAVLAQRDEALDRLERARRATRDNPIAAAMVERAAALATGNRHALDDLVATFAALGCPYQQTRTITLAAAP